MRAVSGDVTAVLLEPTMAVTADFSGQVEVGLRPELVIACHELCVVKCVSDDDWYMGTIFDDGSILCWSIYATLEQALRGL
ncbi:hypothetical protein KDL01_01865 [Actinospica durhamensis]|uniref:Uncharacterized protein n=1 Tax=Actinospica durhamensis TaxID=1508375 RepID=A0A941EJL3_9ACTN|nr:hypothetical protein [Actinospica durhamensis]MBR7831985.1 hypothetical protein [Actinospica durhamensis]